MASDAASSSKSRWKYDVFLSFRGKDTRYGFTDHLYEALQRSGIKTFRDEEELERGGVISKELPQAIEESFSAVVILSKNYASSTWCLDELQKILESRIDVFPVFYGVDPSDVRHQKGSFAEAFKKHEERFGDDKDKVQKWRNSLKEVADLCGQDSKDRYETELIKEIIADVWKKLQPKLSVDNDGLVGIESKKGEIISLLRIGLSDVLFVGIWGMGGIGKTTLARTIYYKIHSQYDISCFLDNVREDSKKNGLVNLQRKLLSHFRLKDMKIDDPYEGKKLIRRLLCHQKVLLVLDDVSNISQLENLAGRQGWFGPGSRVIVTTRDRHLLTSHGGFEKYEAKILDKKDSFKLFCQEAFKGEKPSYCYLELTKRVIRQAGDLPLTLKVLGSSLCGRSVHEWEGALEKTSKVPSKDILKQLRISYDALDDMEKNIFLDVAFFFKGMNKNRVIQILEIRGFCPKIGIPKLIDKSLLIEYDDFGTCCLGMHDILQDMGKNIVYQESPKDASKRTRLCLQEDIDHMLTKNKGNELTEGIILQLPQAYEARWNPEAFSRMCNLSILIISCNLSLPLGLKYLSNSLKIIQWTGYPFKALPPDVQLDELVHLTMHHSKIKQLGIGTQPLAKLNFIDLSYSEDLIRTLDFSILSNLELLILKGCINLVEVHPSLGQQKKLVEVNLKDCKNLKVLPTKLEMDSLKHFILSGCLNVKKLPEFGKTMKGLIMLDLKYCKNLVCLPSSIHNLKSLRIIDIHGCSKFSSLPDNLNENKCLEELDVGGTAIKKVPQSIFRLHKLKVLSLRGCSGPTSNSWEELLPIRWVFRYNSNPISRGLMLPPSVSGLSSLIKLDLSYCNLNAGSIPDDLGCFPLLQKLDLSGNNFGNLRVGCSILPPSFSKLTSLLTLKLCHCNLGDGSIPDDLSCLSSLYELYLQGNNFTSLPTGCLSNLFDLEFLSLSHCQRLKSLPELPPNINSLWVDCCFSMEPLSTKQLQTFTDTINDEARCFISGSEIPQCFDTRNCNFLVAFDTCRKGEVVTFSTKGCCCTMADSIVSMKVDIPDFCRSNEEWGIYICLVLQDMAPTGCAHLSNCQMIIASRDAEYEFYQDYKDFLGYMNYVGFNYRFNCPHLFVGFVPCNSNLLRVGWKQVEFICFTRKYPKFHGVKWESRGKFIIRKCGWRLVWNKDIEEWHRTMKECSGDNISEIKLDNLNDTEVSSKKRSRGEFEGGDATVTSCTKEKTPIDTTHHPGFTQCQICKRGDGRHEVQDAQSWPWFLNYV